MHFFTLSVISVAQAQVIIDFPNRGDKYALALWNFGSGCVASCLSQVASAYMTENALKGMRPYPTMLDGALALCQTKVRASLNGTQWF
ncbi:hypothetical protein EDD86DRAFT_206517 [Gorgonomyces haynaldii]|nr:hypothetical protein EDD86DRAFT_206517 [Gorgonomyces haynaldii]